MKTSILIVTYGRDFRYLVYALRSVSRFARGFHEVVVSCPSRDRRELETLMNENRGNWPTPFPVRARYFDEWPGKGMLHHFLVILNSDHVTDQADFVLHMDSDHVFTKPVTPEDYMTDGLPDFVYAGFEWLCAQQPNLRYWQVANQNAMGVTDEFEFMRRAPIVHVREVYILARAGIENHTKRTVEDYLKAQRNEFPQSFAEFQALGSTAWRLLRDRYHWRRQEDDPMSEKREPYDSSRGWRPGHIRQAWSHRPPTDEDLAAYKELGLI